LQDFNLKRGEDPMTEEKLVLAELLEKAGEGDFLRAVAEAVLQLLMEADVEGLIGAGRYERSGERTTWRNRHRDRTRHPARCAAAANGMDAQRSTRSAAVKPRSGAPKAQGLIAALRSQHNLTGRRSRGLAVHRTQTTFHQGRRPLAPHLQSQISTSLTDVTGRCARRRMAGSSRCS
jgi:hypothetical protein